MKKKAELAIAALAVMFICFALGYFAGRRSIPSEVTIMQGTVVITPAIISDGSNDVLLHASETVEKKPAETSAPVTTAPVTATPGAIQEPSETTPEETEVPTATPEPTTEPTPIGEPHYTEDGLLRINLATQAELETLPGIGEVIAGRIIEYRNNNGPFSKLSTLKVIKGIGDSRYAAIKDSISVE